MVNTTLNEKFVSNVLPTELFSAGYIFGQEIFTSLKLRDEFISVIKKHKVLDPVQDVMIELVKNWVILPVYTSSNIISFIATKVWKRLTGPNHGVVAFYAPATNRVYMLFESQVSLTLQFEEEFLIQILLHEVQHLCAKNLKKKYYEVMYKVFDSWYKHFFNAYLNTNKITEKMVHPITYFVSQHCEWTRKMFDSPSHFRKYQDMVSHLCDICGTSHVVGQALFHTVLLYYEDSTKFVNAVRSHKSPYFDVYISCMEAYKRMGYPKLNTIPCQEFLAPSEIACMTTMTKPLPQHYSAIKLLRNLKVKPIIEG